MTIRICMWSGPRSLSTAMMRSFGSRPDCAVLDEPFFAPYLATTGIDHPGRTETLAIHETDPDVVAKQCLKQSTGAKTLYFQKHMPHHMVDSFPRDWMRKCRHFFLLRDPAFIIASYAKGRAAFTASDLGFLQQAKLYEEISDWSDKPPPVISSEDILASPESMLARLCTALDIQFSPAMLRWKPGRHKTDGAWAPYWYKSVENSTCFGPPRQNTPVVHQKFQDIENICRKAYTPLHTKRLQIN